MKVLAIFVCLFLCASTNFGEVEAATEMRWCTISVHEEEKCAQMRTAFADQNLSPSVVCVPGDSLVDCMKQIEGGRADLATMDGYDVYTAGKEYGLKPIILEVYERERYHGIAVVKATDSHLNFNNLKGKNSCHTGVRRTAGWNIPVGFLLEEGYMEPTDCGDDINAVANYFNQSCASGAYTESNDPFGTNPASLCSICTNPACPPASAEVYQSYFQEALRCLVEGEGDVAFIKPATIEENTDGAGTEDWNRDLQSSSLRLLCPDNTQALVSEYANCHLAKAVAHAVMTFPSQTAQDIQDFQEVLQEAVTLFGADDNTNGFAMFDSPGDGRDLLFKDSTQSLMNLPEDATYLTYLDTYGESLAGLKMCPANTLRWCTISNAETEKCRAMKEAFKAANLEPELSCYQEESSTLCIDRIHAGDADVVTLDGGDLYIGGREDKIVPVASANYGIGDREDSDASYWAVAVAKKGTQFGIDDLQQLKSCHTGISKTSGWNVPVGHLIKTGHIMVDDGCDVPTAVGAFFSGGSCVPGAKSDTYDKDGTNPQSLCALCIGEGSNNCVRNSAEPYYDYSGAFRCLAEDAGDVAFVKHTTVVSNTDGNGEDWSVGLRSDDYELLCPDNTRQVISNYEACNLAKVPSHAVVTAASKTSQERREIWDLLNRAQNLFGSDDGDNFKMFDSKAYGSSNLIFKDSTVNLVDVGSRDTVGEWLSEEYVEDLHYLYCKRGGATHIAPAFALVAFTALIQVLWIGARMAE